MCRRFGLRDDETPEAHLFFRRSPLDCGVMRFRTLLIYQRLGLALVAAWGSALSMAHLYVAHQHSGSVLG
ncbi:hypothetical protein ACQY0O_006370 [Thecaphora frezii]